MTGTGLKTEYDISDIDEDKPSSALCLFFVSFQKEFKFKIACSKRSDSGERCRVKKAMKSRGGLGILLPRFYFFALLFTSHRSPLSERLEQAKFKTKLDQGKSSKICKTVLWLNETSKILNNKVGISGEVYILEFALRAEVSYCHERLRKC